MTPKADTHSQPFLNELRTNGGFVSKACEAVGISRQSVYNWRDADPEFKAAWDRAVELGTEDLEIETRRRALHGVDEPVFYKGEICGQIRKYSDTLLMFALKARKPEYRDKITIDDSIRAEIARRLAELASRGAIGTVGIPSETGSESVN